MGFCSQTTEKRIMFHLYYLKFLVMELSVFHDGFSISLSAKVVNDMADVIPWRVSYLILPKAKHGLGRIV